MIDSNATLGYDALDHGLLVLDSRLKMTFDVISVSLGFVVPVGVLVFCNSRLICSLRQSSLQSKPRMSSFLSEKIKSRGTPRSLVLSTSGSSLQTACQ